ncbi:MAG: hypothetical protein ACYTGL_26535 [Planctomycetota bacterium]
MKKTLLMLVAAAVAGTMVGEAVNGNFIAIAIALGMIVGLLGAATK